jgi:hypothetical protein
MFYSRAADELNQGWGICWSIVWVEQKTIASHHAILLKVRLAGKLGAVSHGRRF